MPVLAQGPRAGEGLPTPPGSVPPEGPCRHENRPVASAASSLPSATKRCNLLAWTSDARSDHTASQQLSPQQDIAGKGRPA